MTNKPRDLIKHLDALDVQMALPKPIGLMATLGDSRIARIFYSLSNNFGFSGYTHFTWAQTRLGHPFKVSYNGGNSGDTSDKMLARVALAALSGAGTLLLQIGVNDINNAGVGYTTTNTVGPNQGVAVNLTNVASICFANIRYAVHKFLKAGGQRVIINLECGAEVFGTGQIAAVLDLNQYIREFAEITRGVYVYDLWSQMVDTAASTTTTLRFKAGYAAEAVGSGTHQSNLGAYMVGKDFATWLAANFQSRIPYLPTNVNEVTGITANQLLLNPLFMTTAGGVGSGTGGITGTVPGSWTADRLNGGGAQTCAVSTGTPADGSPGKECIMACTFAGAGDTIRLRQDPLPGNWNINDIVEGVAAVTIDAGGPLAGVQLDLQHNDGSQTMSITDLKPLDNGVIGTDGGTFYLKTPPYKILAKGAGAYLTMRLYAIGSGAGNATVRWRTVQVRKRFSL
jgi:lysophospholipase L1-like esterase